MLYIRDENTVFVIEYGWRDRRLSEFTFEVDRKFDSETHMVLLE
jgi:hypothetical protein